MQYQVTKLFIIDKHLIMDAWKPLSLLPRYFLFSTAVLCDGYGWIEWFYQVLGLIR